MQLNKTACYCCREVLIHGQGKLAARMLWKNFSIQLNVYSLRYVFPNYTWQLRKHFYSQSAYLLKNVPLSLLYF
jgi:hypothetical protein